MHGKLQWMQTKCCRQQRSTLHWPTGAPVQQKGAVCGRRVAVAGRCAASWAVEAESLWQHTQCWQRSPGRWSAPRLSHCCRLSQEALKNEWMQEKPFMPLWKSKHNLDWNENSTHHKHLDWIFCLLPLQCWWQHRCTFLHQWCVLQRPWAWYHHDWSWSSSSSITKSTSCKFHFSEGTTWAHCCSCDW